MKLWFALLLALSAPPADARDRAARAEFQRYHPCPSTGERRGRCPGFVIDHIMPLACGGPDRPDNMQWQEREAAKAKDRWELYCEAVNAHR
jgi:hypothetical protein